MNPEEERLRALFQHLKADDERDAPPLPSDWSDPVFSTRQLQRDSEWRWSALRLMTVAAALIVLGAMCVWFAFFRQSTKQQAPIAAFDSEKIEPSATSPSISQPRLAPEKTLGVKHRRRFIQPRSAAVLISQWRSPTESLLRTPGEQMLKQVPRLDESLISIKTTITNQN